RIDENSQVRAGISRRQSLQKQAQRMRVEVLAQLVSEGNNSDDHPFARRLGVALRERRHRKLGRFGKVAVHQPGDVPAGVEQVRSRTERHLRTLRIKVRMRVLEMDPTPRREKSRKPAHRWTLAPSNRYNVVRRTCGALVKKPCRHLEATLEGNN